ncbi:MAG TPA: sialidase family protein [Acidimicrobiales bacterium]|nr:sialidase family protein [Acidimicrobiales bacterium]
MLAAAAALGLVGPTITGRAALDAPPPPVTIGADAPATANDLREPASNNSPMLLADPTEPRFVVLAHRRDAPEFGCGLQASGDGGRTFVPANPVPEVPEEADRCYAPEVAFARDGRLYYLFIGLAGEGNNPVGVYLTSSTDRARTFERPRRILGPSHYQVRMAIDGRDRLHLVWLKAASDTALGGLTPDPNPLFAAHSDDGGRTFSTPVQVSDPHRPRSVAPALAVGRGGAVHVAYYDLQDDARDYQGLEGPPWDGTWSVVVSSSHDRGRSFGPGVAVDEEIVPPGRVMLIYTMAPPSVAADGDGNVYVAWTDARHGDPDVLLARSSDGGRRFEPAQRVNDDPVGNGRDQYLPRLGVTPAGGRLDVAFLDRRNDPENFRNEAWLTWSTDGGRSFAPNVRLSSDDSDSRVGQRYLVPSAEGLYEIGGRLGLLSLPASAIAAWPDTRNAAVGTSEQNLFTAHVHFSGVAADTGGGVGGGPGPGIALAGAAAVLAAAAALAATAPRRSRLSPTALA